MKELVFVIFCLTGMATSPASLYGGCQPSEQHL